jgi:hypothetical protein
MNGFRGAVQASGSVMGGSFSGRVGSAPTPFDNVDGYRLVGPQGSHPLAALSLDELLKARSDGLQGTIEIKHPVRIGEAIDGRISVTALKNINARTAMLRLVGAVITEEKRSDEERDSKGNVVRSESWVEVQGKLFEELPFSEFGVPATMTQGQTYESDFQLPAPRLGPPSGHYGSAIIAWAVEAKWDVSMGGDERVAAVVKVAQNIDYLRSGAVTLGEGALFDAYTKDGATISIAPLPPIVAGQEIDVTVSWPSAGGGRAARIELQADVQAPNGISDLVLFSTQLDPNAFQGGTTVKIQIPDDAPPSFTSQGVGVDYRLRALVDRQLRSDLAVERSIAVM